MNNKQLVEMPQQTENTCHGHISFVLARGVLQARCGDKNFKAGAWVPAKAFLQTKKREKRPWHHNMIYIYKYMTEYDISLSLTDLKSIQINAT